MNTTSTGHTRTRGFVLVMTLVLLMLAVASMVGLARRSALAALGASDSEKLLQRRWLIRSVQATLLAQAERIFIEQERRWPDQPAGRVERTVQVDVFKLRLVLADEQAKVNLNALLQGKPPPQALQSIKRLLPAGSNHGQPEAEIRLRPDPSNKSLAPEDRDAATPMFVTFGQVFDAPTPQWLMGDRDHAGASSLMTCWGDGRLNLLRADAWSTHALLDGVIGELAVDRLLTALGRQPRPTVAQLVAGLSLTEAQRRSVAGLLADRSTCHSLWVELSDTQRAWHELAVRNVPGDNAPPRDWLFRW